MSKTHWLKLGVVAAALLLIPRRSSRDNTELPRDLTPDKPQKNTKKAQNQPCQSDE